MSRGLLARAALGAIANLAVATLVVWLPAAASQPASTSAQLAAATAEREAVDAARAQPVARGIISPAPSTVTAIAEEKPTFREHTVTAKDTLASLSTNFGVSAEAIAFANGIRSARELTVGRNLTIPPAEGALYTIGEDDTIESVAARFKVDVSVVMDSNRLHFEPERFAAGEVIFVPQAALPALVHIQADQNPVRPTVVVRAPAPVAQPAPAAAVPPRTARLSWPVAGLMTQGFWSGHTGVDIAAAYGTAVGASEDGVVSATGWVAVGGLRACVQHAGGLETCYYHMAAVFVSDGQVVTRGQPVGSIGMTGVTTGPHVHWECKSGGLLVNCLAY